LHAGIDIEADQREKLDAGMDARHAMSRAVRRRYGHRQAASSRFWAARRETNRGVKRWRSHWAAVYRSTRCVTSRITSRSALGTGLS
jgi:hypothetical protein